MLVRLRQLLPDRSTTRILALCVAVALGLDFLYFTGYYASDDLHYLKAARQIAHLGQDLDGFSWRSSIANTRLGITIPSGLVYWATDGSIATIAWFHVLYHLLLVVLAYAVGREVADARTGLLAAALIATSPILYVHAGAVLPDNATAVWLGVLLLLLLRARRRALEGPIAVGESFRRYFVAGLVLGVACACKETAIIMTVPCAAVIVAAAPRLRSLVWVRDGAFLAAGLILFVLLEALLLRMLADEWLSRLGEVQAVGDTLANRMDRQGTMPHERLWFLWSRGFRPFMPMTSVGFLAAVLAFPLLRRRNLALLAFFWWPLLYMTLGTTNFSEYRPSSIQARYYAIVLVPAAAMAAMVLGSLIDRWESWEGRPRWTGRRWAAGSLVVVIALTSLYEVRRNLALAGNLYHCADARAFVAAYQQVRQDYPEHTIVLSHRYQRLMTPLLFPRAPANVFAHRTLTSWDPGPVLPLVLLSPLGDDLPEGRSLAPALEQGEVQVQTLGIVYPVRGRFDILVESARRAFGGSSGREVPRATRGAAVIQLVTGP